MLAEPNIKNKYAAIHSQFDLLSEKIKRLREAHAIETDVATRFKLEKQIEQAEAERDAIERQLEVGERQRPVDKSTPLYSAPIPNILPYLSDRSEQEMALGKALRFLQENKPRRPFLCIIHGDEWECHDMYLERLRHVSLLRFLKLDTESVFVKNYVLKWPSISSTQQRRFEVVQENLADMLVGNSAASIQEMIEIISRHEMPVMIETHLHTQDWLHSGSNLMIDFIDFWNRWTDLVPGRFLCVCLCFAYKRVETLGILQKSKFRRFNNDIRNFFTKLDFSAYENLHGVTLPELCAISRKDVEDWVREHAREFCHIDELLPKIRALYEHTKYHTPEGRIPMEKLAGELKRLLNSYRYN